MREIRFHRDLYPGTVLDVAIKTYEPWAELTRSESETHWIVQISSRNPAAERRIAGELANYALGLTVRDGPPSLVLPVV